MNQKNSLFPPSILLCYQLTSAQVNLCYILCNAGEEVSIERTEGNTGADMVGQPKSRCIWDEKTDNLHKQPLMSRASTRQQWCRESAGALRIWCYCSCDGEMVNDPHRPDRVWRRGWPPFARVSPVVAELMRPSFLRLPLGIQLPILWDLVNCKCKYF